jgi:hypothetical protein
MFHKYNSVLRLLKFSKERDQTGQPTASTVRVIWWLLEGNHKNLMQASIPQQLDFKRTDQYTSYGVPSGFFGCSRGVRQGDPLSPFLFVLVMEAFSRMLGAFTERGLISGFSVGSSGQDRVNVSHLLFADDTLVFCGANTSQIRHLGALLVCFEAVAGLKVNLSKSILIPVGHVENVGQLAGLLGCGFGEVPLKYLGLPLGASFKSLNLCGWVWRI